jgi:ankyrin repeat protein
MDRRTVINNLYQNNIQEVRQYLDAGGDPNFRISEGLTALGFVNSAEMAELLLERGANIHFRGLIGRTPLLWQAMSPHRKSPEIIQALLRADPNIIDDVDDNNCNALHLSVMQRNHGYIHSLDSVRVLLDAIPEIDINAKTKDGLTALELAKSKPDMIEVLRKTRAAKKIAGFLNKQVNKERTLHEAWRGPNGNGNLGGNAYQALASKYSNGLKTRKRRRKARKARSRKI